ncbi:alpha/beta hydrolase [Aliishimia ponticola]|uniref:Alpha/beta hydrolase n=1 Tax=Aliishimia ponticola TaxID=2499833 RepID=A0A4S4NEY5_9RHOB|nr:alpha/beta hydrolase [Aliishimia ponticola]THH37127.1 alpha/beta hydrolase [Aliishimia ponticola]
MSRFTTSDGLSLHYEDSGDGLPVLCLAGLTRTSRDFDYVAPHLAGVRLIRMDYRGRGQSDWGKEWAEYALPIEVRDVMELLEHLGLPKVAVLGTSRGGLNAMGMAAAAPDVLLGVAFNDVGPVIEDKGLDVIAEYIGRHPHAATHEQMAAALAHVMQGFDNVPADRWLQEARTQYRQTDTGLEITYDPRLRDATLAAREAGLPDLWPFFDALPDVPLAVIRGANSELLSEETVAQMKARRPNILTTTVPGRGHVPFLDEPESVSTLTTWIEAMT